MSREWAQFASTRRTLRVSKPQGQQRSTYWLQLPYRYSVPLMGAMVLLHWLMSRGLFLASIREQWEPCSDPGHRRLRLLTPGNPARFLPDDGHDRGTNLAGALQVHQCGHPCRELLLCGHQCGGPPAGLRSRRRGCPSAIAIRCCPRDCSRDAEAEAHWHGQNALCKPRQGLSRASEFLERTSPAFAGRRCVLVSWKAAASLGACGVAQWKMVTISDDAAARALPAQRHVQMPADPLLWSHQCFKASSVASRPCLGKPDDSPLGRRSLRSESAGNDAICLQPAL